MAVLLTSIIVAGATAAIFGLGRFAAHSPLPVSGLKYLDNQATYQILLLIVAVAVAAILHIFSGENFWAFFGPGNIAAPARRVAWLGIADGESWLSLGLTMSVVVTLATSAFIYFQVKNSIGNYEKVISFLPWIILFSLTNSFSEEMIFRLGVIVPLAGKIDSAYILLISAVAFGLPHFRGMPNGFVGVLMAGFMGWLLAKSVVETSGIFWAWAIHFLQDMVILSAFVMAAPSPPA